MRWASNQQLFYGLKRQLVTKVADLYMLKRYRLLQNKIESVKKVVKRKQETIFKAKAKYQEK
jgi:hypothetical protein